MTQDQENKIREEFMNEFAGIGSIDLVHNGEEQWQEFVNRDKDVLDWWFTKMKEQIEIAVRERDEKYNDIFKWLMGDDGDSAIEFPDLSKPPHYRFRSILKQMLDILSTSPKQDGQN